MTAPKAQPWLTALDQNSRRIFADLRETATPEQRATIRSFVEHDPAPFAQSQAARLVALLLMGNATVATRPVAPHIVCEAIERWTAPDAEGRPIRRTSAVLLTFVDEILAAAEAPVPLPAPIATLDGFQCASLRGFDPRRNVAFVVGCGMVQPSDPRHPYAGTPQSAQLRGDGMYHLPRAPRLTPDMASSSVMSTL
jgi:hypothetical protein